MKNTCPCKVEELAYKIHKEKIYLWKLWNVERQNQVPDTCARMWDILQKEEINMKWYSVIHQALRRFHIGITVNFEFKNIH